MWRRHAAVGVLCGLVLAAYANHFRNGFHFDDGHAIVDNIYVRDVRHIPRYFIDATTFSVLPSNQTYRPLLQTTFAIDYWIGGYNPSSFRSTRSSGTSCCSASMAALFKTDHARRMDGAGGRLDLRAASGLAPRP